MSSEINVIPTVVSGSAVAILGFMCIQALTYYIFKVIEEYHWLRGKVSEAMIYYANVFNNRVDEQQRLEMSKEVRKLAAATITLSYKRHFLLVMLPTRKELQNAGSELIGLSNASGGREEVPINDGRVQRVERVLKLRRPSAENSAN